MITQISCLSEKTAQALNTIIEASGYSEVSELRKYKFWRSFEESSLNLSLILILSRKSKIT
jgi:hypothetical protein